MSGHTPGTCYNNTGDRQMSEWQPIETAPRDGSLIWLGSPEAMRLGFWTQGKEFENHGTTGGGWRDMSAAEKNITGETSLRTGLHFAPTHWMPTPKPPKMENDQ